MEWVRDRKPTIKDGDERGYVLTVEYGTGIVLEKFDQILSGMPWLPLPTPPKKPSTRWSFGSQPNFLTDGEYTVIVSGGNDKRNRDKVLKVVLESLNMELP